MRCRSEVSALVACLAVPGVGATGVGVAPAQAAQAARLIADVRYLCTDNSSVRARYYADRVRVTLPAGGVTLRQRRAASGTRYANDTLTFWSKGPSVIVERRGSGSLGCTEAGPR